MWSNPVAYKDILVHLDSSKATADRMEAAIALAERQGARLREKAVGGVTDTIIHQMTTPVLMSE